MCFPDMQQPVICPPIYQLSDIVERRVSLDQVQRVEIFPDLILQRTQLGDDWEEVPLSLKPQTVTTEPKALEQSLAGKLKVDNKFPFLNYINVKNVAAKWQNLKLKIQTKYSSLKCCKYADSKYLATAALKYADSKYLATAALVIAVALALFSNPIGALVSLSVGLLALGKTIYKNKDAIKDCFYILTKKSTPDDEINNILNELKKGYDEDKGVEIKKPIFIDGQKYVFSEISEEDSLYQIIYKNFANHNDKLICTDLGNSWDQELEINFN